MPINETALYKSALENVMFPRWTYTLEQIYDLILKFVFITEELLQD